MIFFPLPRSGRAALAIMGLMPIMQVWETLPEEYPGVKDKPFRSKVFSMTAG